MVPYFIQYMAVRMAVLGAVISAAYTSPIFADAEAVALRALCWIDNKPALWGGDAKFAEKRYLRVFR